MSNQRYEFSEVGESLLLSLRLHPLNARIYGTKKPDDGLLKSVKEHGVLNPIVINSNEQILSGVQRWFASLTAGYEKIPVIQLLNEDDGGLLSELFLIESNRSRNKTKEQRAREFTELKRIETELAKQRQATSTGGSDPQLKPNLAEAVKGQARDKAAEAVGLKRSTAEKLEKIVHKADTGDPAARQTLDEVNAGSMSVDRAYREVATKCPEEQKSKLAGDVSALSYNLEQFLSSAKKLPKLVDSCTDPEVKAQALDAIKKAVKKLNRWHRFTPDPFGILAQVRALPIRSLESALGDEREIK